MTPDNANHPATERAGNGLTIILVHMLLRFALVVGVLILISHLFRKIAAAAAASGNNGIDVDTLPQVLLYVFLFFIVPACLVVEAIFLYLRKKNLLGCFNIALAILAFIVANILYFVQAIREAFKAAGHG